MQRHIAFASGSLLAAFLGVSARGAVQDAPGVLDSYTGARAVVAAALDAHGGRGRLARPIDVRLDGESHWRHQSPVPEPPFATTLFAGRVVWDPGGRRVHYESTTEFVGGFRNHRRQVRTPSGGFDHDIARNRLTTIQGDRSGDLSFAVDRLPHSVLLAVLDQPGSLRSAGTGRWRDRAHDMVDGSLRGTPVRLYFDAASKRLSKYDMTVADTYEGDAVMSRIFDDYQSVDGIAMPRRWRQEVAGTLTQSYRYADVRIATAADLQVFSAPSGVPSWTPPPVTAATRSLGAGLHLLAEISPGYNVLLVEFSDHVLVVDAPIGSGVGQRIIEKAAEIAPSKPVRYVVPTHHHEDHAGAMRAFINAGTTIVTTASNGALFERMAAATFTLRPDALGASPKPPRLEIIAGPHRRLGDAARTIEIHNIGPSPHVRDMLVVYVPAEGVLFQGDLGSDVAYETSRHFLDWIQRSGLDVRTIAGTHNAPMSLREYEAMVLAIPAPSMR